MGVIRPVDVSNRLPLREFARLTEGLAFHQFADQEILADIVNRDDIGVVQRGHGASIS